MQEEETIILNYSNFQKSAARSFQNVRSSLKYCDITLACDDDDTLIEAHKVILASGSTFFEHILERIPGGHLHPLLFLSGVGRRPLETVLDFLYMGEASLPREDLSNFLKTARKLGVRGLKEAEVQEYTKLSRTIEDDMSEVENYIDIISETGDNLESHEPSKGVKSGVWKYFEKAVNAEDDQTGAQCKICGKIQFYNLKSMSTAGLLDHMRQNHKHVIRICSEENNMSEINNKKWEKKPVEQEIFSQDSTIESINHIDITDRDSCSDAQHLGNPEVFKQESKQTKYKKDQPKYISAKDMVMKLANYKWQCKVCAQTANFKTVLFRHVLEHM